MGYGSGRANLHVLDKRNIALVGIRNLERPAHSLVTTSATHCNGCPYLLPTCFCVNVDEPPYFKSLEYMGVCFLFVSQIFNVG